MWERLEPWLLWGLLRNEISSLNVCCESVFCASHVCVSLGQEIIFFSQMFITWWIMGSLVLSHLYLFFDRRRKGAFLSTTVKKILWIDSDNIAWIWNPPYRMEIFQTEKGVGEVAVTKMSLRCCIFQGGRVGENLSFVFCCCCFGGSGRKALSFIYLFQLY